MCGGATAARACGVFFGRCLHLRRARRCCGGSARQISARPRRRRRRGCVSSSAAAVGAARAARGAATALLGVRLFSAYKRPRRAGTASQPSKPYRKGVFIRALVSALSRTTGTKSGHKSTVLLVSLQAASNARLPHSLLHTEDPSGGPGNPPRRPRRPNVATPMRNRLAAAQSQPGCPTMDP